MTSNNVTQSTARADKCQKNFPDCWPADGIAAALAPGDFGTSRLATRKKIYNDSDALERGNFAIASREAAYGPSRRFRPSAHFRCWRKLTWQRTSRNRTE
jgi:hypothetical protein